MSATPARPPEASLRAYTRIDWKAAARLIALGQSAEGAAMAIGVDEDRLWRHWHRSPRFRLYIQACMERRSGLIGLQLGSAAPAAALVRCQAPDSLTLDAAMLALLAGGGLQAAQRGEPAAEPAGIAAGIGQRVAALGAAGYPARKRPAGMSAARPSAVRSPARPPAAPAPKPATAGPAAKPAADETPPRVVTVRRLTLHRATTPAQQSPAMQPTAGPATALPASAITVRNGPERAETVQNGLERAETGEDGTQPPPVLYDMSSSEPSGAADSPPLQPWWRARHRAITDLPSPDFPHGIPIVGYAARPEQQRPEQQRPEQQPHGPGDDAAASGTG